MTRSHKLSGFARSLGRYERPKPGEELLTKYEKAKVLRVLSYEQVVEEMKRDFVYGKEIERFDARVEHFLRNKARYFEAELRYPDGEVERIDWSEYLALKNKAKR